MTRALPRHSISWPMLVLALAGSAGMGEAAGPVNYQRDIRPLLSNTCYQCHGPDAADRETELRLDQKESVLEHAVKPGESAKSLLFERIAAKDPADRMPPADSGKSLTPAQVELIRRWIDEGADWQEHWSFIKPVAAPLPKVVNEDAVRNAIDRFIVARLEAEGLKPSPEADRLTLIRRVTFDLTGLPPTLEEIDAFVTDDAPNAYEKLVDRLLDSPRYGEQIARFWLDAARYGDTHGLHLDNERSMWPYRNWVIDAFNQNMPFDQFTVEQIAGDLLPEPTQSQRIATGFNRCNVTTSEGGSIAEEYLVRYAVDRVETTSTVWLGLTAGCAVCHDHKYDPITQKEFYQLFAFFNSLTENAMDGNAIAPPPVIQAATLEQRQQEQLLAEQVSAAHQQVTAAVAGIAYIDPLAGKDLGERKRADFVWIEDELPPAAKAQASGDAGAKWEFVSEPDAPVFSGKTATKRTTQGLGQHFFTDANPALKVGAGDTLFAYVYLDPANPPKEIMLQFNDGSWEHRAYWGDDVIPWGDAGKPNRLPMGPLPELGKWTRLEVSAEKVGLKAGAMLNGWAFTQQGGTAYWDQAGISTLTPQAGAKFESLAEWEQLQQALPNNGLPAPIQALLKVAAADRNDGQKKQLQDYFVEHVYSGAKDLLGPLQAEANALQQKLDQLRKTFPSTLVMQEMPQRREAFVLVRGEYDQKSEKVEPGVPAVMPPLPADLPANRLALAKWLVDPDHPLPARVTVNRFWQQYFGTGIVETSEDFGSQGEWPSHPELLDWLAVKFVRIGWDVKALQKLIVMSATYRQSSHVSPELYQADRNNRLLARGPRFRLDAEMIRDNALFVSGLLVEELGGKSVKPYQPSGLWEAVGYTDSNTAKFVRDNGNALYRRSLYTFWKRTAPPPSMLTFDAPSRESCTVRRARTNTPLQALNLMNDTQYVEAARQLGQRIMLEGGQDLDARLTFGFRLVTARPPKPDELAVLRKVHDRYRAAYQENAEGALELVKVGDSPRNESLPPSELATWTMIANLLLNLNEVVTKG